MRWHPLRREAGMTMIEVVVVLVILAILAAMTIPSLNGFITDANQKNCRAIEKDIANSYVEAFVDNGIETPGTLTEDYKKNCAKLLYKVMREKGSAAVYNSSTYKTDGIYTFSDACPNKGTYTITFSTDYRSIDITCSVDGSYK